MFLLLYFFAGKLLFKIRLVPQLVAPPMIPPTTALPTRAAPATTIGAIFSLGEEDGEEKDNDKEGSTR